MHGYLVRKYLVQSVQTYVISAKGSLSRSCQTRASLSPSPPISPKRRNVQYRIPRKRRYPSIHPPFQIRENMSIRTQTRYKVSIMIRSNPSIWILNPSRARHSKFRTRENGIKSSTFRNQWHESDEKNVGISRHSTRYPIGSTPRATLSTRSFINASNHPPNDNARKRERERSKRDIEFTTSEFAESRRNSVTDNRRARRGTRYCTLGDISSIASASIVHVAILYRQHLARCSMSRS